MPEGHPKGYGPEEIQRALDAMPPGLRGEVEADSERLAKNWVYANGRTPETPAGLHLYGISNVLACLCYLFLGGYIEFKVPEEEQELAGEPVEDEEDARILRLHHEDVE